MVEECFAKVTEILHEHEEPAAMGTASTLLRTRDAHSAFGSGHWWRRENAAILVKEILDGADIRRVAVNQAANVK